MNRRLQLIRMKHDAKGQNVYTDGKGVTLEVVREPFPGVLITYGNGGLEELVPITNVSKAVLWPLKEEPEKAPEPPEEQPKPAQKEKPKVEKKKGT